MEGRPVWWSRGQDANGAERTVDTDAVDVTSYADNHVQSTERHPMQHLASVLAERCVAGARIGVEMENDYYSAKARAALGESQTEATLIDATALVNWQRGVKSQAEIASMRKAARIAEAVTRQAIEMAEPEVHKNDIAAELTATGIRGVGDDRGDCTAIVPLMLSGADAAAPQPDLERRPDGDGVGDVLRTRRLLPSIPHGAHAHRPSWRPARSHPPG